MVRPVDPARAVVRRQQIIDAAGECFRTKGFHETNMAAICAAAGLSPGAVYRYFPSKDALIGEIMREHVSGSVGDASLGQSGPVALRNFARRIFCVDDCADLRLRAEIFTEASRRPEFFREFAITKNILETALRDLIRAGQDAGDFRTSIDAAFAASSLVYCMDGLIFRAMTNVDGGMRASEASDIFEKIAMALLVAADAKPVKIAATQKRGALNEGARA